jgi:outer membrane protein assembly factor BamD (BamD/ComL family)
MLRLLPFIVLLAPTLVLAQETTVSAPEADLEEGARGALAAARMYESIAQFSDAAHYYETHAGAFPSAPDAADSLHDAVRLRLSAGDHADAVRDGNEFLERYPGHPATDEIRYLIARAEQDAKHWHDAAVAYRRFLDSTRDLDREVEATTRLAEVLAADGDARGAEQALEEAVRLGERNRVQLTSGLFYAARARYLQGVALIEEYEAIAITGPVRGLRNRLTRKAALLAQAANVFASVGQLDVAEWTTAALYQIAHNYEAFAEALREAPAPFGSSAAASQAYRDELATFIVPMEDEALQAYERGYEAALRLHIFNRWTRELRAGLTRLNDVQYVPLREMGGALGRVHPLPVAAPLDRLVTHAPLPAAAEVAPPTTDRGR